ncbi:cell division protein CrgA [Micrococcoides hystricis]|uniref:Cell division protein CrgA n=1 Tax=Micrococcoides hystricis TaxID=1572761 RepID=A0ABV6P9N5_9MICC
MHSEHSQKQYKVPTWLRTLTWVAVAITVICLLALIWILIAYFTEATIPPVLYALGLFGLPMSFALMLSALIVASIQRRRAS